MIMYKLLIYQKDIFLIYILLKKIFEKHGKIEIRNKYWYY